MSVWEKYGGFKERTRVRARPWWWWYDDHDTRWHGPPPTPKYVRADGMATISRRDVLRMKGDRLSRERQLYAMMDELDRERPMKPPPPAVGQVWRMPRSDVFMEEGVTVVQEDADGVVRCRMGQTWYSTDAGDDVFMWPPRGAILLAGPGAPWVPAGWRPNDKA